MSRVLCFAVQSVRHLSGCAVADTFYRSTLRRFSEENRTSRPPTSVYMNFQLPKCTACRVTTAPVGSYPTLLTLTGVRCETLRRRLFLLHEFAFTDDFPLRSGMPYAARTFLTHHTNAGDELSGCSFSACKSRKKSAYAGEFRGI